MALIATFAILGGIAGVAYYVGKTIAQIKGEKDGDKITHRYEQKIDNINHNHEREVDNLNYKHDNAIKDSQASLVNMLSVPVSWDGRFICHAKISMYFYFRSLSELY